MKHVWEEKDIEAGLYIIKNTSPKGSKNLGFACTVVYKIGFDHHNIESHTIENNGHYGAISCLTDGWYRRVGSKQDICDWLNKEDFRLLSKSEYINLIQSTNQGFLYS